MTSSRCGFYGLLLSFPADSITELVHVKIEATVGCDNWLEHIELEE